MFEHNYPRWIAPALLGVAFMFSLLGSVINGAPTSDQCLGRFRANYYNTFGILVDADKLRHLESVEGKNFWYPCKI